MKKLSVARNGYNAVSVGFCLAALWLLLFPDLPASVVCVFSGAALIAYGIIKIVGYFSEDLFCLAFRYDLAFGLFLAAMGVLVLIKRAAAAAYLAPGFGWITLLDCFFKIQMSQEAKKFGLERWGVITLLAAITGAAGILLILGLFQQPHLHIVAALALFAEGIMNRWVIRFTVKEASSSPEPSGIH